MAARITAVEYAGYHDCSQGTARRHLRLAQGRFPQVVRSSFCWIRTPDRKTPLWWKVYEVHLERLRALVKTTAWGHEARVLMNLIELIEESPR